MHNSMATRRRVLGLAGAVWTTTLAGCETLTDDESQPTTEPVYDHLEDRSMYVAADVDLEVPPSIPTVDVRGEADLFLLPAEPHVSAATAIDWLDEGLVVALVGDGAQETWIDWQQTEAYGDAFGGPATRRASRRRTSSPSFRTGTASPATTTRGRVATTTVTCSRA
jgi:hypothetical protein